MSKKDIKEAVKEAIAETKKPVFSKQYLRYEFSQEELRERANSLARNTAEIASLEAEKTAVVAQFKEKIERAKADAGNLARDINQGWEMRNIECRTDFHVPVVGTKRTTRIDTGEVVREQAMSADEMQDELFTEPEVPVNGAAAAQH